MIFTDRLSRSFNRGVGMTKTNLRVFPEVAAALRSGGPVVALESTLIAHGLPWPLNYETALAAEAIVREEGAVPATIAVLAGRPCIGLSDEQTAIPRDL